MLLINKRSFMGLRFNREEAVLELMTSWGSSNEGDSGVLIGLSTSNDTT